MKEQNAHCPICSKRIGLPVWVEEKFGRKFAAYCIKCKRAFKAKEIKWQ
jgi:Zn ribbon nucleic-acid-binding protein